MKPKTVRRHALLLLTYLTYVIGPQIHDAWDAAAACAGPCPRCTFHGPALWSACELPCHDPAHHHHQGHDRAHCGFCKSYSASDVSVAVAAPTSAGLQAGGVAGLRSATVVCSRDPQPHVIRGPPDFPAC